MRDGGSEGAPALVAISHGTDSVAGRALVGAFVAAVRHRVADTHGGFVDVLQPDVATVLRKLPAGQEAVVVPLLFLSRRSKLVRRRERAWLISTTGFASGAGSRSGMALRAQMGRTVGGVRARLQNRTKSIGCAQTPGWSHSPRTWPG